jgi:N-acetylglucosamine kinase-like BadF-type ATPase
VVNDALPVLVAGSPDGWGVALISGTGSLAFGRTRDGGSARAGGWGHLFGDEGSGYSIALAGLRAAAKSADGRGPETDLVGALLERLSLQRPEELIPRVYPMASERAMIASLAEVVVATADRGDAVAEQILGHAAYELAAMVGAVTRRLGLHPGTYPLALAGGVLLGSEKLVDRLRAHLRTAEAQPATFSRVSEPVLGAVILALRSPLGPRQSSPP